MSALSNRVKRLEPAVVDEFDGLSDDELYLRLFQLTEQLPDKVDIEVLEPEDKALFEANKRARHELCQSVRKWAATHLKTGFGEFAPYEAREEDMLSLPLTGWGHKGQTYHREIRARLRRHPSVSALVREGMDRANKERAACDFRTD